MNENGTKRREWVKNAAIIFLTILLILTFFSNTIMNYSLPEVAAQYVQSGTITAKIRGNGVIESGDPYNVEIDQIRTVESVNVKAGDTVQKGDILFYLTDEESEELTAAEEELATAQDAYDKVIQSMEKDFLVGSISEDVFQNAKNGVTTSFTTYRNQILDVEARMEEAKRLVTEAEEEIADLTNDKNNLQYHTPDTTKEDKEYNAAKIIYDTKNKELTAEETARASRESELAEIEKQIEDLEYGLSSVSGSDVQSELAKLEQQRDSLKKLIEDREKEKPLATLRADVQSAKEAMDKKEEALNNKKNQTGDNREIQEDLDNWNKELTARQKKVTDIEEEKTKLVAKINLELGGTYDLDTPLRAMEKAREKVEKLREKTVGAVVEAPVSGVVTTVDITAGEKTVPNEPLATMQPEGKGFTMSFSVTNEQAKRLAIGDVADLVNSWRYDDVTVTLVSIKPDTTDPGQKKLLTFDVTGSVMAGQTLNVSVGQKSANYDLIVPNSAIREDNNGKFILTVESKPSPIGTRYVATRVDVEVLASDDTQSAVSGGLYGYEFVITTSTKPVEAGKLVRLADN